ncbi:NAD-dependent epimerase/dehydratase family protein [Glycomyces albidus]|uniref:NAD-dependent epimerase/dehydratase family protein n=1 Tax=Glycomyces albidus TaxID=2656774 RepID=A0A6L5G533_9ACTN|nr:NAD(P)-dependent oxidoreductase [Glycomyces albidus]MQM24737.1 NAD-dependent epimerase/dehydratase family protein [Glycomyces albidus]
MKVLVAGATGAIGRPLTRALIAAGHEVLGLARSAQAADAVQALGADPVRADAMDRSALLRAVEGLSADAVVCQLTALSKPKRTLDERDMSTALRKTGTANLLAAADALGATRLLAQSLVLGYGYRDHGDRILTEDDPFGEPAGNLTDHVLDGLNSTEDQTRRAGGIALRYGCFYGPGTWFDPAASARSIPVPRSGGGVMSWIHVDDAAAGTVAALERGAPGAAYNLVDDTPSTWGAMGDAIAAAGGRPPMRLPDRLLRLAVPYLGALMIDTDMRVSHDKATRELGWRPEHRGAAPPATGS